MSDKHPSGAEGKIEFYLNPWLLFFWVSSFLLLFLLTGFRGWLVWFLGNAGAVLLAFLWMRSLRRHLRIDRKLQLAWARVGDSVHEQFRLINSGRLPALWVEIVDSSSTLAVPLQMVTGIQPQAVRTRHFTHLCRRRGLYTLGPTRLRTGDPFGIFTLTILDHHAEEILVTPPILPIKQLKIVPGGWAGDQQRRRHALQREISDVGVRQYAPGDSLRRIHWRVSAHTDSLIVRQLEAISSADWLILVDLEKTVQAGTGLDSTLELSVVMAASLAMHGLSERRRVGLAMAAPQLVWLEPRADPTQRWRILRSLALAQPGETPLSELLTITRLAGKASLLVITPTWDPAWVAKVGQSRRDSNVTVFLLSPGEFGSRRDQEILPAVLANCGIPYLRVPRGLLFSAYPSLSLGIQKRTEPIQSAQRYLKEGGAAWRVMD